MGQKRPRRSDAGDANPKAPLAPIQPEAGNTGRMAGQTITHLGGNPKLEAWAEHKRLQKKIDVLRDKLKVWQETLGVTMEYSLV